jgi:hypothetical protein
MEGRGIVGRHPRCHAQLLDWLRCRDAQELAEDCRGLAEDYIECLHHRRERARLAAAIRALEDRPAQPFTGGREA